MENSVRILVVDDEAKDLRLMQALLVPLGYIVDICINGEDAQEYLTRTIPDVILLDVIMPNSSGIETCRKIKEAPHTSHIPVILVTSLSDRTDRIQGIAAGANDFISKPIDIEDIALRVRNAAHISNLYKRQQEAIDKLTAMELLKNNLTHMIVHDLRSPLASAMVMLELTQSALVDTPDSKPKNYLARATHSLGALQEMIGSLLDINRMEEGKFPVASKECSLQKLLSEALEYHSATKDNFLLESELDSTLPSVWCDPSLIRRVLSNLLGNAFKFSPHKSRILIRAVLEATQLRVSVWDNGPGIPAQYHVKIFEKFGQVAMYEEHVMHSIGLGLTFCKLAIEAHGGNIGVTSVPGEGCEFFFTLPLVPQNILSKS